MFPKEQHTDGTGAIGWESTTGLSDTRTQGKPDRRLFSCHFFLSATLCVTPLALFPSLGPLALSNLPSPIFELLSKTLSVN